MQQVTIVLRLGLGLDFEAMRDALRLGAPVSIGRGGAVIATWAAGDALKRLTPALRPHGYP